MSGSSTTGKRSNWRFLRDLVIIVVAALLASFLVKAYLVRSFYIPSASMENTLLVGDRVLVNELVPKAVGLQRGDVVVFKDPGGWLGPGLGDDLIKRVIGLPGDTVSCCDAQGRLQVNGHAVDEPYVLHDQGSDRVSTDFTETVPAGKIWVMGDNRYNSADSRVHGPVPESDIVGRAFVITWPISRWSTLSRYGNEWDAVPDPN
ncbi:signal peptidase I [Curtobacterium sp. PhB130]|uniref:signal peptidase I n=1 Tax=unclassified Curtobacterium TaxID=257496 RepID=UPI000F4C11CC|nr:MULTISPECIES: signal peptidase I [unclassified Curtobacterium]ROS78380.1 signal peptidase I [Curtobacterium sp. PhB130]TCK65302.1 signal peptidase I [Curtobacterium sp. PhB136]